MKRTHALATRLREVLLNGKWIANTNYKEQLLSLNYVEATTKIADLNTIAALTFHINYYLGGLLQVLKGGELTISDTYSFDMPEIKSENDWNKLVNDFINNAEAFSDKVDMMDDSQLELPFVNETYGTYLRNIEGVIEHSYYHLGQISLIRKMILVKAQ
jgi:uncharacterized damage-inducible protein DinB